MGDDYYIATSTFEWWPGVDIYHSTDLVNWEWVAAPLNRPDIVNLRGNYDSGSIWAPHLSYAKGLFCLVFTDVKSWAPFKDMLNYVITAPSITGPWSEPTFMTASGFDPALYHDDDGRSYFLNMLFDWRLDRPSFAGTVIQEFDTESRRLVGERKHFYKGTSLGVCEGRRSSSATATTTCCAPPAAPAGCTPPPWRAPARSTARGRTPRTSRS